MDAYVYAFFIAWALGILAGRVTAQFSRDVEAYNRAFGTYGDSYTVPDDNGGPVAGSDNDGHGHTNGAGFYLSQYRDARRRTVLRDYGGPRSGRHAAGGDSDFADAAPLT